MTRRLSHEIDNLTIGWFKVTRNVGSQRAAKWRKQIVDFGSITFVELKQSYFDVVVVVVEIIIILIVVFITFDVEWNVTWRWSRRKRLIVEAHGTTSQYDTRLCLLVVPYYSMLGNSYSRPPCHNKGCYSKRSQTDSS
jgi:hypothetical protein